MKAGILEVADVLVVNKSDLDGADQLVMDLEDSLRMREVRRHREENPWTPPVVTTSALREEGIEDLRQAIAKHRAHLEAGDLEAVRRKKRVAQVRRVVGEKLEDELWGPRGNTERADSLLARSITPYDVAEEILGAILGVASPTRGTS